VVLEVAEFAEVCKVVVLDASLANYILVLLNLDNIALESLAVEFELVAELFAAFGVVVGLVESILCPLDCSGNLLDS